MREWVQKDGKVCEIWSYIWLDKVCHFLILCRPHLCKQADTNHHKQHLSTSLLRTHYWPNNKGEKWISLAAKYWPVASVRLPLRDLIVSWAFLSSNSSTIHTHTHPHTHPHTHTRQQGKQEIVVDHITSNSAVFYFKFWPSYIQLVMYANLLLCRHYLWHCRLSIVQIQLSRKSTYSMFWLHVQ